MVLSITTNTAALNVQRNLNKANEASASSLAKLSSGSRVPTAKDDAASLAIGSRVEAEIAGLKQASVNASQATSLLQIADGAYTEINDVLVRQSSLAIQSSSGQLSDTERAIIDSEFQELNSEVDRIANDTEFNGNKLLNGGDVKTTFTEGTAGEAASFGITVNSTDATQTGAGDVFQVDYAAGVFTVTNTNAASPEVFVVDATDQLTAAGNLASVGAAGTELTVDFGEAGISLTLNETFNGGNAIDTSGATDDVEATVVETATTARAFDFKVGTGTVAAEDNLNVTVEGATTNNLGTAGSSVETQANAELAVGTVKSAIDSLQESRAKVGASLSRLDFASSNIAVAIENQSAAKSGLLDTDVASETTNYASQQVIVQAGVSLLAQANQQPNQLLKLLG